MPESAICPTLCQELCAAFQCDQLALMLRSVLFLTCFTAILHHAKLLDWVDVVALKFLPENAIEQKPRQDNASFRTLVLGITPDLFENEFGGHTPLNRDRFRKLIQDVLVAYPKARVLAVDYDFSPSGAQPCASNSESSVCEIAKLEAQQQKSFEEFLRTEFGDKQEPHRVQLVLITPLPFPEEHAQAKRAWLDSMSQAGVRFGDHALLYHNWFATVVKHLHVKPLVDPCARNSDVGMPFAAVVNEAGRCAGLLPVKLDAKAHDSVDLINFAKARNAVFLCPLWEWSDTSSGCRRRLQVSKSDPDVIDTIFIGSSYGEEDKFRTPLGDQYGVDLHAFGAYSQIYPLGELKYYSFGIDLLIGLVSAFVFHTLWNSAVQSDPLSKRRFFFILMVFAVLILVAWIVMRITPWMLKRGTWMNPLMILLGLFIDSCKSYFAAAAIERIGEHESHSHAHAKPSSRETFQAFIGWPPPAALAHERVFQLGKKVLFYWGVVLYGLYFTFLTD